MKKFSNNKQVLDEKKWKNWKQNDKKFSKLLNKKLLTFEKISKIFINNKHKNQKCFAVLFLFM